jgi:sulfhydrogenase subunit alpha
MNYGKEIQIDYLARVEGEASIAVTLDGQPDIKLKIFEPPRFFEGFLVGRKFNEVGDIVSRICGICPVSHMTTAILAIEQAMGIKVSAQTKILRKLMTISEIIASHLVHLYMLAMPDYYGFGGIVEMRDRFTKEITRLMQMKEVVNNLTGLIGGRALHPVTHLPGGFTAIPSMEKFAGILKQLRQTKPMAAEVVKDISQFSVPDFHSDSEYVALDNENEYAVDEGNIVSTRGLNISVRDYLGSFEEAETSYAFAKKSTIKGRGSFMTGALARLNNKFDKLGAETKSLAKQIGFTIPNDNPFYNNLAQSLEVFDGINRCMELIESNKFEDEDVNVTINAGQAGVATEAPRGLLYHWYKIDRKGFVEQANIVSPTAHHFLNIEKDLKKIVGQNKDKDRDRIRFLCEQLVRAYDPCFSCSVH